MSQVIVTPGNPTIELPRTVQLQAQVLGDEGQVLTGVSVQWSSLNADVATVSSSGLVTGKAEGSATVVARAGGEEGGTLISVVLPVAGLTITPASPTMPALETQQLTASATGPGGEPITPVTPVWSVNDPELASVSPEGVLHALAPGAVTVAAVFRGASASTVINIGPPNVASVEIWTALGLGVHITDIPLHADEPFAAIAFDREGHILPGRGTTATWASSNPAALTVDESGLVRSVGAGATTLVATVEGVSSPGLELTSLVIPPLAMLAAGDFRTCAAPAPETGEGYCWGVDLPARILGGHSWRALSVGDAHTCGITDAGAAYCWGVNAAGQLGDGTITDRTAPVPVAGGLAFQAISAGSAYTCGVTTAKRAYCWGDNRAGQLGNGTTEPNLTPTPVSGDIDFESVSTSRIQLSIGAVSCGVSSSGDGYCWGTNSDGNLGTGDSASAATPRLVAGGHQWKTISTGLYHACGLATTGTAYCWGANPYGGFGNGTLASDPRPTAVNGGPYADVSAGYLFSCAVTTGGSLVCFGTNEAWQLGIDGPTQSETPVAPAPALTFSAVSAGRSHGCGLTIGGVAWCWGGIGNGADNIGVAKAPAKVVGQP